MYSSKDYWKQRECFAGRIHQSCSETGYLQGASGRLSRSGPTRISQGRDMGRRQTEALVQVQTHKVEGESTEWMEEVLQAFPSTLGKKCIENVLSFSDLTVD
jgi:hypothetical protein